MKAITQQQAGGPETLIYADVAIPAIGPDDVLVRVKAIGVNRADVIQREGKYPVPPGASPILGLEIAGIIEKLGENVTHLQPGQRVFGLVNGGAYAEYCAMDAKMAMPIPENLNFVEAAAIAEAFLTAQEALFTLGELQPKETVLIHAGASGVGSAAIQLAKLTNATVITTAGDDEKLQNLTKLGADIAINYKSEDFFDVLQSQNLGVDVILDFVGRNYLPKNLQILNKKGRLVQIAFLSGPKAEIDLSRILYHRLQIKGLLMRAQSAAEKHAYTERFITRWLPYFASKKLVPIIDSTFPFKEVALAHERMEANLNYGKIILTLE